MRLELQQLLIDGPAGRIDTILEAPAHPKGIALVAHPHPLYGGANNNKVAQTLARTLGGLGYAALRPNFRGVGGSEGEHDEGRGETEDLLVVLDHARQAFGDLPVGLAGFS